MHAIYTYVFIFLCAVLHKYVQGIKGKSVILGKNLKTKKQTNRQITYLKIPLFIHNSKINCTYKKPYQTKCIH